MSGEPMFLDRKAAAKTAGVSVDLLTAAIRKGTLRAKRTGVNEHGDPVGKFLITHAALEAWYSTLEDA
jgi:hypothetical protein